MRQPKSCTTSANAAVADLHSLQKDHTMLRMQKILVPIDFSLDSQCAVHVAESLARDHGATLVLAAAAPPPPVTESLLPSSECPGLVAETRRNLVAVASTVTDLPVEIHVLGGEPGPALVAIANNCDADLIVMGTHGRTGLTRMLMGSVAEYVLRHARCPVLTMKPGTEQHLQQNEPNSLAADPSA